MRTIVYEIEGMHCEGCASVVQALLKRSDGVREAAVSYAKREARVRFDPALASEGALADAISRLGYRVAGRRPD